MANDGPAEALSDRIQQCHLLYGFISETQFASATSDEILCTAGNGDGALWTGCYLAAEAFRYAATGSQTALTCVRAALSSVRALASVPESSFLVRSIVPADSPYVEYFKKDQAGNGVALTTYKGRDAYWAAHPTRDQYAGVLFGLGVVYDLVGVDDVHTGCAEIITSLVQALIDHGWIMSSPGHPFQETYLIRPDHWLSVLRLAKHVNASQFASAYGWTRFFFGWATGLPLGFDVSDVAQHDNHYYEFNVDYLYWYHLIGLEDPNGRRKKYKKRFQKVRNATQSHLNAHFQMLDHVLYGSDASQVEGLLSELLTRGFRSDPVDLNGTYPACATDRACDPIPVADRPYQDFLWQRDPFEMKCNGVNCSGDQVACDGSRESAGVDYLLPYWMARYHGVIA